ncbi:hypothetical protein [Halioxenophilus aromaticivorans]|uniref:Uncharacterized protein n=1 Tax=Halioxenophilus aromaticivorans TaxID=1306992 RepID=A0AAV3U191_9ALTE
MKENKLANLSKTKQRLIAAAFVAFIVLLMMVVFPSIDKTLGLEYGTVFSVLVILCFVAIWFDLNAQNKKLIAENKSLKAKLNELEKGGE